MKKYKLGALNVSDKGLQDTKEEIVIELIDRMQKYVADGKAAFENGSFTTEQKLNQVKYCCGRFCGLSDFLVGTMGIDVRREDGFMYTQETVAAPETVPYNIDVTYYTQTGGALGPEMVAQNVAAAVAEYQRWQAAKMGRDVNPSYLTSLLMQTGAKRVEVRSPVFAPVADNAVAVIGETEVLNGGAERE